MSLLLRAEFRKISSTKLWWGLLVPVVLLALLVNVFGGLFTLALGLGPRDEEQLPLLLASLAYTFTLTALFATVHGVVATAGEFRHRTVTTTYLAAPDRGAVLLGKMTSSAAVGALYGLATALVGVLGGLLGQGSARFPEPGALLAVAGIGMAVTALWSALGAALGTALGNQVGALVTLLGYVLLGELLLSVLLGVAEADVIASLTAYLPVNAGETALYDIPARVLLDAEQGADLVGAAAGVTGPLPWWGALLVLAGWVAAVAAVAWWAAVRRDIT